MSVQSVLKMQEKKSVNKIPIVSHVITDEDAALSKVMLDIKHNAVFFKFDNILYFFEQITTTLNCVGFI